MIEDKDRFDRFMKLAEFRLRRWDARRSFEWKISLSLWGLLAATAYYIPTAQNMWLVATILVVIFVGYAAMWSLPILVRNDEDMATAFFYTKKAEQVLGLDVGELKKPIQQQTIRTYLADKLGREK